MPAIKPSAKLISYTPDPEQHIERCGRICYGSESFTSEGPIVEFKPSLAVTFKDLKRHVEGLYKEWPTKTFGVDSLERLRKSNYHQSVFAYFRNDSAKAAYDFAKWCPSKSRVYRNSAELFIENLREHGHWSVIEHSSFTVLICASRACLNQITRHRMFSYSQTSLRYTKLDENADFVVPPTVDQKIYENDFKVAMASYKRLLEWGTPPEDARFIVPLGIASKLTMTGNARSWNNFLELRLADGAQWEIQSIARQIADQLIEIAPNLFGDFERQ